jgi:excisionase family DNA binding protein
MARRPPEVDDAVPLFVRLPAAQATRLSRAASEMGTSKKSLITALVAKYADDAWPAATTARGIAETGAGDPVVGHASFVPYEPADVLTCAEAAELLRVAVEAVDELAAAGELPGRRIAGDWRFSRAALLRWLDHEGNPRDLAAAQIVEGAVPRH